MTTKTPTRGSKVDPPQGPTSQDFQAAYQVHTLAQMVYGQLYARQPWVAPSPLIGGFDPRLSGDSRMHGMPGPWNGPSGWYR